MRNGFLVFATALVAAQIAVAQNGISGSCDANSCATTYTFGPMGLPYVVGAAFSGQQSGELVWKLPDGTHKVRPVPRYPMVYRDSQGRTRIEHPVYLSRPGAEPPLMTTLVEIQDPVSAYMYLLDTMNRVAHRVRVQPAKSVPLRPTPLDEVPGAESLGTKLMFGVTLKGQRTTSSTGPGVDEIWSDPVNGEIVARRITSATSDYTAAMPNYSNAEPDPALFRVPAGYAVVDESGPFTIVTPRAH